MIDDRSSLADIAFAVCSAMDRCGAKVVLTGGSAATYYAPTAYQSSDLDFVLEFLPAGSNSKQAMIELGFIEETNCWSHPSIPFTVDFLAPPLAIGDDLTVGFATMRRDESVLYVLTPTDSVRDRLAWFYFANDYSALSAAIGVAKAQIVDLDVIREWSIREGELPRFEEFVRLLNARS